MAISFFYLGVSKCEIWKPWMHCLNARMLQSPSHPSSPSLFILRIPFSPLMILSISIFILIFSLFFLSLSLSSLQSMNVVSSYSTVLFNTFFSFIKSLWNIYKKMSPNFKEHFLSFFFPLSPHDISSLSYSSLHTSFFIWYVCDGIVSCSFFLFHFFSLSLSFLGGGILSVFRLFYCLLDHRFTSYELYVPPKSAIKLWIFFLKFALLFSYRW